MNTQAAIGDNLRMYRARKKSTQHEIANKLDVHEQTVANWENGNSMPSYWQAWKLADLYGVTLDELGGRNYEP